VKKPISQLPDIPDNWVEDTLTREAEIRAELEPQVRAYASLKFQRNLRAALDKQAEILAMPLDEDSPAFKYVLAAQTSISNNQINAGLKYSELALKAENSKPCYDEIKKAVEEYHKKAFGDK
jgi:hypothetical protein